MLTGVKSERVEGNANNSSSFLAINRHVGQIAEVSQSRNEWEETLGESQMVASHSMKPLKSAPMQLKGT